MTIIERAKQACKKCRLSFCTDFLAGFEVGFTKGKERLWKNGKLYNRSAPSHLTGKRYLQWTKGYERGLFERTLYKKTIVSAWDNEGNEHIHHYSGHNRDANGKICSMLEKKGCTGEVSVTYFLDGEIVDEACWLI